MGLRGILGCRNLLHGLEKVCGIGIGNCVGQCGILRHGGERTERAREQHGGQIGG